VLVHVSLCILKALAAVVERLNQALRGFAFAPRQLLHVPPHLGVLVLPHLQVLLLAVQQVVHLPPFKRDSAMSLRIHA